MSAVLSTPVVIAVSATAVACVAFTSLNLLRQVRLRRHLHRLRTTPLDQFAGK